jgi:arylsulfatase A-like enzyme
MFAVGGGVAAGARSPALVSTLDLYPTVVDLAGAGSTPGHAAGRSLRPILRNPTAAIRDSVFSECVGVGGVAGQGHRMARTTTHKYVLTDTNEEYLFDLRTDPVVFLWILPLRSDGQEEPSWTLGRTFPYDRHNYQ